ncbi:MAG: hypothetical protein PVJ09_02115 [Candidatus Woesebacteria bacterium]
MRKTIKCSKCKGKMELGFIGDSRTDLQIVDKQKWGTGLKWGWWGLKNNKEVKTYRCSKCGYLESYAE